MEVIELLGMALVQVSQAYRSAGRTTALETFSLVGRLTPLRPQTDDRSLGLGCSEIGFVINVHTAGDSAVRQIRELVHTCQLLALHLSNRITMGEKQKRKAKIITTKNNNNNNTRVDSGGTEKLSLTLPCQGIESRVFGLEFRHFTH